MNRILSYLFWTIVIGVFLVFGGYQAFRLLDSSYRTVEAGMTTTADTFDARGLVVRDEVILPLERQDTVIQYLYPDAARVKKNTVVAEIYADYEQILLKNQMDALENQIQILEDVNSNKNNQLTDVSQMNEQILEGLAALGDMTFSGKITEIDSVKNQLLRQMSRKQLITGQVTGFEQPLAQLKEQYSNLQARFLQKETSEIRVPVAGYFVGSTDGYEQILTGDYLDAIDAPTLQMLLEGYNQNVAAPSNNIGKVITGYNWSCVIPVPAEEISKFRQGGRINVSFADWPVQDITSRVYEIRWKEGQETGLVFFSSNLMSAEFAAMRFPAVEITFQSYTGVEISRSALRFEEVNGEFVEGVYVLEDDIIRFKRIYRVYEKDDMILSEIDTLDTGRLQQYDQVVTEGKNLYDGKQIR